MNYNFLFGRLINVNNKIITVIVKFRCFAKIYNKQFFYYKKIKAMDMYNECKIGDYVLLRKTRLIRKSISWLLIKVLERVKII